MPTSPSIKTDALAGAPVVGPTSKSGARIDGAGMGLPGTFVSDLAAAASRSQEKLASAKITPAAIPPLSLPGAIPRAPEAKRTSAPNASKPASPARLPRQSKGKVLVAGMIVSVVAAACWLAGFAVFPTEIGGVVEGSVFNIHTSAPATIKTMLVREGDTVEQGDILCSVENPTDRWRIERLTEELHLAESNVLARTAELQTHAELRGDRNHKALAEYHECWGNLLAEQAKLKDLEVQRQRLEPLLAGGSASLLQLEALRAAEVGQRNKVRQLEVAVEQMRLRVELLEQQPPDHAEVLRPALLQVEHLKQELVRAKQETEQQNLRAPVTGQIISRPPVVGKYVESGEPILQLIEQQSHTITLYVPQSRAHEFEIGQQLSVIIPPQRTSILCEVETFGTQLTPVPPQLLREFKFEQQCLPIYLRPLQPNSATAQLRLGSVVQLPSRHWERCLSYLFGKNLEVTTNDK